MDLSNTFEYQSHRTVMQKTPDTVKKLSGHDLVEAECLRDLVSAVNDVGVTCWLDQGTLLGIIRDKRFLPLEWDHDFDLGIWWDEYEVKKYATLKALNSLGWKVCQFQHRSLIMRHMDKPCRKVSIAIYYREGPDQALKQFVEEQEKNPFVLEKFLAMMAYILEQTMLRSVYISARGRGVKKLLACGFVVLGLFARLDLIYKFLFELAFIVRGNVARDNECVRALCASKYFESFQSASIENFNYKVPREAEEYLELKYGKDWRTPRKEWNYLAEDGAIVREGN